MLVLLTMLGAGALLLQAARGDSVTIDEFAHLPAGLYYLHTGRFNLYNLSPPLLRLWCALPAWWAGADGDFAAFVDNPNHWLLGYHFMARNAERYQQLFVWARLPVIALVMALILVLSTAARRAFGAAGGVTAAALCAFCPNILAHGHLVTTDLGHTLFFVSAVLAYERALRRLSMANVLLAGTVLGLAQLTKFTALLLYPLLLLLTVIACISLGGSWRRYALAFLACVIVSALVLNAGYLFEGVGTPLASYEFRTPWLQRLAAGPLGRVPLPVPADFISGYDQQAAEAQGQYTVFFHGELSRTGWWYYYLAALSLKTPLPTLLLVAVGAARWTERRRWRDDALGGAVLFLPPLLYLMLFSWLTDINLGVRYVLPVYPFLFLIAASVWRPWPPRAWMRAAVVVLVLGQVGAALRSRPYYLSYFNALAGGSENGYRWLIDSNVDWGQELLRLRAYLVAHGIEHVHLAYFGRVAPEVYGIDYETIAGPLHPAVYVVSASYLMGRPYYLYDRGQLYWAPRNQFTLFQQYTPTTVIGHSLFVFDLR